MERGFIFYESFGKAFKQLEYAKSKELIDAMIDYAFNDEEPIFNDEGLNALFEMIKVKIKIVKEENER